MRLLSKLHDLKNQWIQIASFDGMLRSIKITEIGDDYLQYLAESRDGGVVEVVDPFPQGIRAIVLPNPLVSQELKKLEESYKTDVDLRENQKESVPVGSNEGIREVREG